MGSLRTRYLVRRRDTFYFRRWVPRHLTPLLGVSEVKVSLSTIDPAVARERALLAELLLSRLLSEVKTMTTHANLSNTEIRALLNNYYQSLRVRFRDDYERNTLNPDIDPDIIADDLLEHEIDLREGMRKGNFPKWAIKESIKSLKGGEIDFFSLPGAVQGRVSRGVCEAWLAGIRETRDRYKGRFDEFGFGSSEASNTVQDTPKAASIPVQEAVTRFLTAKVGWAYKTDLDNRRVLDWFKELVGPETDMTRITKEHIARYRDFLEAMPKNFAKYEKYQGIAVTDMEALADQVYERVSARTAQKYMLMLRGFLNWCRDEEIILIVPGPKIGIKANFDPSESRDPFDKKQLRTIFNAPVYTGCHSIARRNTPGDLVKRDGKFWIPLIALFSGMRAGEIIQLNTVDIRKEDGVTFFDLMVSSNTVGGSKKEGAKKLKNNQSRRRIPVHPELIRIGFLDYVRDRKDLKGKGPKLFPDVGIGTRGDVSHNFSKWFRRFLNAIGAKTTKTAFHSFRHNFKDALANADIEDSIQDALMGHLDKKQAKNIYGSQGKPLPALEKAMAKVTHPVDLSHLIEE